MKFTRTDVHNDFFEKRKVLAAKNLQEDPVLKKFLGGKIYIFVSLTPQRKRLYGDNNKYRKKLMWKLICSYNGRQDLSKNETATGQHAFDNADDFAKFTECFIK